MAEESRPKQEPWQREHKWQRLAMAIAAVSFVGLAAGAFWIFRDGTLTEQKLKTEILTPFFVLAVAAITFCTVIWRGLISQRQANAQVAATNLQREQIDKLAAQIAATEENNLAQLLQKGAELIAETEAKAHVAAGVATLSAVATARNPKFAVEAMNLLADYVQANYLTSDDSRYVLWMAAIAALRDAATIGRRSTRRLELKTNEDWRDRRLESGMDEGWPAIPGVREVIYDGGEISWNAIQELRTLGTSFHLSRVHIEHAFDIELGNEFSACEFELCNFSRISCYQDILDECAFYNCSFSGAVVEDWIRDFPDLRSNGNCFRHGHQPRSAHVRDWSRFLICIGSPDESGA